MGKIILLVAVLCTANPVDDKPCEEYRVTNPSTPEAGFASVRECLSMVPEAFTRFNGGAGEGAFLASIGCQFYWKPDPA